MIASFGDQAVSDLFHGKRSRYVRKLPADVCRVAARKLDMLNAAQDLRDLRSPPGNRLEALKGDLSGLHSIRINDQWRLVFHWQGSDAEDVRILDDHRG